jgi:hypothetical protein
MNIAETIVDTVVASLALIISIATAIYSGSQGKHIASSDFKAEEQVKSDTVKILAALRSIMQKYALLFSGLDATEIDFSKEKSVITDFLNSETGFAYYSWTEQKNTLAIEEGKKGEPWRVFFYYLAEISVSKNICSAATRAADLELLLSDITNSDLIKISEFNSDLSKAIAMNFKNINGNPFINALISMAKERRKDQDSGIIIKKLNYLKSKGIKDPSIDYLLATEDDDASSKLKAARDAGADTYITDSALLNKYAEELKDFGNNGQ